MDKKETVHLRITPEMKRALDAVSTLSDTPVSEIVRHAINGIIHGTSKFYTNTKQVDELLLDNYKEELEAVKEYTVNNEEEKLIPIRKEMFTWGVE